MRISRMSDVARATWRGGERLPCGCAYVHRAMRHCGTAPALSAQVRPLHLWERRPMCPASKGAEETMLYIPRRCVGAAYACWQPTQRAPTQRAPFAVRAQPRRKPRLAALTRDSGAFCCASAALP